MTKSLVGLLLMAAGLGALGIATSYMGVLWKRCRQFSLVGQILFWSGVALYLHWV